MGKQLELDMATGQTYVSTGHLPEPELIIAFFVGQRTSGAWHLFDNLSLR